MDSNEDLKQAFVIERADLDRALNMTNVEMFEQMLEDEDLDILLNILDRAIERNNED